MSKTFYERNGISLTQFAGPMPLDGGDRMRVQIANDSDPDGQTRYVGLSRAELRALLPALLEWLEAGEQ